MYSRYRNYYLFRNRKPEEVTWIRSSDCVELAANLPRPVVLVNGCFDLLHSGHMRLLFSARLKAGRKGTLIVAMDSDRRVKELKGHGRPILSWIERAVTLNYMPINYLVEFDSTDELRTIIRDLHPDLRVQGDDHIGKKTNFPSLQTCFVRGGGLRTSEIIRRCQETAKGNYEDTDQSD